MGYMLPLKFIRVSDQMSICATRIVAIMSTHAYQARRLIRDEKQSETLLNAAGRGKVKTAIILDNGAVIASPFSIGQILRNIQNADSKHSNNKKVSMSSGLKVYDFIEDEVFNDEVEDFPEIEAIDNEPQNDEIDMETDESDEDESADDVLDIAWDGEASDE